MFFTLCVWLTTALFLVAFYVGGFVITTWALDQIEGHEVRRTAGYACARLAWPVISFGVLIVAVGVMVAAIPLWSGDIIDGLMERVRAWRKGKINRWDVLHQDK